MKVLRGYDSFSAPCDKCGSLLELEHTDVYFDESGHIGFYATCIVCHQNFSIDAAIIPKKVRESIE